MRPSRRLLGLALAVLALSVLIVATPFVAPELALALWGIIGALLITDLLLSPSRRDVDLAFDGPSEVFTGETGQFSALLNTRTGRLPRSLEARLDLAEGLSGQDRFAFRPGNAHQFTGALGITGKRRGSYTINDIWLKWSSRLGLIELTPRYRVAAELKVVPNIRPIASGQIDVNVSSELYGIKENPMRGEGSEFHQLREFTTGMDTRAIDWKRSARKRDLVAKEMRAERNHQIILALDNGYLMREEIAGLPKIDHAVNAALATAWAAGLGGDLVGLFSFDAKPRIYLPPMPGRAAFPRIRSTTAEMAYKTVESNHTLAMAHLNAQLKRRSLVVVFSDFVDTTTAELLMENIAVLNRHHVLIFVAMKDPGMETMASGENHSMEDVSKAVAAGQLLRERQIVLDNLARLGVIVIDTEPQKLTPKLVSTYLTVKAREMI